MEKNLNGKELKKSEPKHAVLCLFPFEDESMVSCILHFIHLHRKAREKGYVFSNFSKKAKLSNPAPHTAGRVPTSCPMQYFGWAA